LRTKRSCSLLIMLVPPSVLSVYIIHERKCIFKRKVGRKNTFYYSFLLREYICMHRKFKIYELIGHIKNILRASNYGLKNQEICDIIN